MLDSDEAAWYAHPQHRDWFNKLRFSLRMGYVCGPNGIAPSEQGLYIVRPIYNLLGMGAGARLVEIGAGDTTQVPPGCFWCERFIGEQLSITYLWDGAGWVPQSSWRGVLAAGSLTRFVRWERSSAVHPAPAICDELADVGVVNIEYIGGHPIEVHLRASPDPQDGDVIVPVWADEPIPDGMVPHFDDADGFVPVARVGFVVK